MLVNGAPTSPASGIAPSSVSRPWGRSRSRRFGEGPGPIAVTPDGRTAYVVSMTGTVLSIATASNTAGPPVKVGKLPMAIAITPDGTTAYVLNEVSGTVTPISMATNAPGRPIRVGSSPQAIAITPDRRTAYVTGLTLSGAVTVTSIDTATNRPGNGQSRCAAHRERQREQSLTADPQA
jgi:YVTN family beta-propeller protein